MNSHQRSYSFSSWEKSQNLRSRYRQSSSKQSKKQYYYYPDNIQSIPSFGDSSIHFNEPSFMEQIQANKNYLRMSRKSEKQHKFRHNSSIDSRDELKKVNQQKIINIERINTQIKKILDTLNEQQKKISTNNFRLANKTYKNYGNRIKTQGNELSTQQFQISTYDQLQNIKKKYNRQQQNLYKNTLKQSLNCVKFQKYNPTRQRIKTQSNWMNQKKQNKFDLKDSRQNFITFKRQKQTQRVMKKSLISEKQIFPIRSQEKTNFIHHQNIIRNQQMRNQIRNQQMRNQIRKQQNKRQFQTPIKNSKSLKKSYLKESSITKNGKNIDDEINKIQNKINSFEKIKKQLDIECSPLKKNFVFYPFKKIDKENRQRFSIKNSKYPNYQQFKAQRCQKNYNQSSLFQDNQYKQQFINTPKPFKLANKKGKQSSRIKEKPDCNIYKNIDSQFVSQDRSNIYERVQIKKFIKKICQQIQLDNQFRNLKKWFAKNPSTYKWIQIQRILSQKNIKLCEGQIKLIFTLTEEQDNPFYTKRQTQGSIEELVDNYMIGQRFWKTQIKNKFNKNELQNQGINQMDMYKQGRIKIQDIVRYINVQSDNYFRNRDLSLIYRRFPNSGQQIKMQDILNIIC